MKLISLKGFSTLIYFNASTLQYSIEFSTLIYINTLQISNGIFNINLFQREYFAIFNTLKKKITRHTLQSNNALMWKFRTNQSNFCYVTDLHRPRLKIFLCDTLECKDLYWKERLETPSTPKLGTLVSFKVIHTIFLKSIGRGWWPLHKGYSHFIFIYKVTFYFKIFLLLFFIISNFYYF